jgi:hypothetical protein
LWEYQYIPLQNKVHNHISPCKLDILKELTFPDSKTKLNCGIIKLVPLDPFRVSHNIARKFCSCYNWNHIKDMCCSFNWKINKKYWTLFTWIVKFTIVFITTVKLNSFDSLVELIHNSSLNKTLNTSNNFIISWMR